MVDVQGEEHVASVGCLVTDGHYVYALTNRHVTGIPGEPVYSVLNGQRVQVGVSSDKQLRRKLFSEVYPEWPGKNVYVDLDIGLVEVHDKTQWTAQIYGLGTMGPLADLSTDNISLRLIGRNVARPRLRLARHRAARFTACSIATRRWVDSSTPPTF